MKKYIIFTSISAIIVTLYFNVGIRYIDVTKRITDKIVTGDRGGTPHYYIITKDDKNNIEQVCVEVTEWAQYKVGKSYIFTELEFYEK